MMPVWYCCRYGGESYYTCDRLTLCPIQKKMMAKEVRPHCQSLLFTQFFFLSLCCFLGLG